MNHQACRNATIPPPPHRHLYPSPPPPRWVYQTTTPSTRRTNWNIIHPICRIQDAVYIATSACWSRQNPQKRRSTMSSTWHARLRPSTDRRHLHRTSRHWRSFTNGCGRRKCPSSPLGMSNLKKLREVYRDLAIQYVVEAAGYSFRPFQILFVISFQKYAPSIHPTCYVIVLL